MGGCSSRVVPQIATVKCCKKERERNKEKESEKRKDNAPDKGRTIRKVMGGGGGNFRAARIFFRYQILCMNFI